MKTNVCNKNFYSSSSKNWISALKHSGIRFSHVFGNIYGDLYAYAANNPVRYVDPDGNYVIMNESQKKRTECFIHTQKYDSIYFGSNNQNLATFGYCFNKMEGDFPSIASSSFRVMPPEISTTAPFSNNQPEHSMNGSLETGFNIVDMCKKSRKSPTPKVTAKEDKLNNGIYAIKVKIEIGGNQYSGIVAYAGESEIMTGKEIDQAKINKIANDSINFLRGTKNEIQNITD